MNGVCVCDHDKSTHSRVGDRLECFEKIAEGWLCGCMNYEAGTKP